MLEFARGLPDRALAAVADLERRVVDLDGGRLKLEWPTLRTRAGEHVEDLLWWDDDRLTGFCALYRFGHSVEVAGMVDPAARRRHIGTALLEAALPLCGERGVSSVLLVVPGASTAGRRFAVRRGATWDHAEHAMVLAGEPILRPRDPRLRLRPVDAGDVETVVRLLAAAFGHDVADPAELVSPATGNCLVAEHDGIPVATVRLERDGTTGGIYGFAVDPGWQGLGIGRDVLGRACELLREDGADKVTLEVAVDNDRALGLYTFVGFRTTTTEDYFALAVGEEAEAGPNRSAS